MINYLISDATDPTEDTKECGRVIMHCCNNVGAWGAGFVMALSAKWKKPEEEYLKWMREESPELGEVQLVEVENNLFVANIIGQDGLRSFDNFKPVKYDALYEGFESLIDQLDHECLPYASIHAPRLGCGLAGGSWKVVESLIEETFGKTNHEVYIYDLK